MEYQPPYTKSDVDKRLDKANQRAILGISAGILLIAYHLATWGSYSLEIRYLQLRDLTGTASVSSMEKMSKICIELKKYNCVEYSYLRQAQLDKSKTGQLVEFQMSRRKFKEAAGILKAHLKHSQKDSNAAYLYARVLSELGKVEEATRYYEFSLRSQPRKLQPEVVKSYVKDLAKAKRYAEAQAVILRARRAHGRASNFMEQEYRLLGEGTVRRSTASK